MKIFDKSLQKVNVVKPITLKVKGSKRLLNKLIKKDYSDLPEDKVMLINYIKIRSKYTQIPKTRDVNNNRQILKSREKCSIAYIYIFNKYEIDQYIQYPKNFSLSGNIVKV